MRRKFKPQHKGVVVRPADTPENRAKLKASVESIQSKMHTAFSVMEELAQLKASRLYMIGGKTWDEFIEDEFSFTKQWADELIAAYDGKLYLESEAAQTNSENNGNSGFQSSPKLTSVKDLAAVGRLAQKKGIDVNKVLTKAASKGKIAHKTIKESHAEIEQAKKKRKAEKGEASPIPEHIQKAIDAGKAVLAIIRDIRAACTRLDKFSLTEWGCFIGPGQHTDVIRRSLELFKFAAPYADCVHCAGRGECKPCESRGWLRKTDFDRIPASLRSTSRIIDVESVESDGDEGVEI